MQKKEYSNTVRTIEISEVEDEDDLQILGQGKLP